MLTPRWYQQEAESKFFEYFAEGGKGNPLIALPTGTGKSLVIAQMITRIMQAWPTQRIMCLTHVKTLIKQNSEKLKEYWPTAPFGIFSAGLNRKELYNPITYGGVKSVINRVDEFGHIDLLFIDEAHLLSDKTDGQYQQIIQRLKARNPFLKVCGLSATPYRMGMGSLTNGSIFTDVIYDKTDYKSFNTFIEQGFLAPLVTKKTQTKLDIGKVGVSGGEFNMKQLEQAVDTEDTNYHACKEMVEYGQERFNWIVFTSGIKHCEHICTLLNNFGISTVNVHSEMSSDENRKALQDFANNTVRCLVSVNGLTTGVDIPQIDMIGDLRPTVSAGLHVQKYGRGTRPSPLTGKTNCLVLDFAGNTARLGPINDPLIPNPKGKSSGVPPIRICPECGTYCHASLKFCPECNFEFPMVEKLTVTADTIEVLRNDMPVLEWYNVTRVSYSKHLSMQGNQTVKVAYVCGKKVFKKYWSFDSGGGPGHQARQWWMKAAQTEQGPPSVADALAYTSSLRQPTKIQVHINKEPYSEITGYEY